MSRAYPNRDLIFGNAFFDEDLRKPFARFHLDAFHAEHKGLIRHVECFYLVDKAAHALRTDGNDDDIRVTDRLFQIAGERDAGIESDVLVFARRLQDLIGIILFRSPGKDVVALFARQIPGNERPPAAAAQNGNFQHDQYLSFIS